MEKNVILVLAFYSNPKDADRPDFFFGPYTKAEANILKEQLSAAYQDRTHDLLRKVMSEKEIENLHFQHMDCFAFSVRTLGSISV